MKKRKKKKKKKKKKPCIKLIILEPMMRGKI